MPFLSSFIWNVQTQIFEKQKFINSLKNSELYNQIWPKTMSNFIQLIFAQALVLNIFIMNVQTNAYRMDSNFLNKIQNCKHLKISSLISGTCH